MLTVLKVKYKKYQPLNITYTTGICEYSPFFILAFYIM